MNANKILVWKPEVKRLLERSRRRYVCHTSTIRIYVLD